MLFRNARLALLFCPLVLTATISGARDGAPTETIDIPYQKFVLDNGLTLIVHEDHKAPVVAVNVWYHVGSKNEKPGKTGFAHLFEHLMFNGSEHWNDDYFKALEKAGATDLNGTTSNDRTNYFQTVPVAELDLALWLESDRMGHMIGAITQERLDEQRGVVQNEKRQGENRPFGKAYQLMTANVYPAGHPYSWTVIGSMEHLDAAALEDVHEWFRTYYGAANAVLSIAGDVDAKAVKAKVEKYFGAIPAGPPVARHQEWIAKRTGTHRMKLEDRGPQAEIMKVWNIPQWGSAEGDYLRLVGGVLSQGKSSRLYKRLVYDDKLATDVGAHARLNEIGGLFYISATAQPGGDLAAVEAALDEELARFLKKGPTKQELERVKSNQLARFIRGAEKVGGFGGKSDILAQNEVFGGSPDYYKTTIERMRKATATDLRDAAVKYLSDGQYILELRPFPKHEVAKDDVDRSKLPESGAQPLATFPPIQEAALSNGLKVLLAERHGAPLVNFTLLANGGSAADSADAPGLAQMTADMLDEGTRKRTALEISDELALLGARIGSHAGLDSCAVTLAALKSKLAPALELYADVILNPAFSKDNFERRRKQRLADIKQTKASPRSLGGRLLPGLLFGKEHPYGRPAQGTEESVASLTPEQLAAYHQQWFKPNNATLIVVGDTTLKEISPLLERLFKDWKPGEIPEKRVDKVDQRRQSAVYLVNQPAAQQSMIYAAHVAPPMTPDDEAAVEAMHRILGGTFTSRINMNLREDKHWTYGARGSIEGARVQRRFVVSTGVQTDKTAPAMREIANELEGIVGKNPITAEEFAKTRTNKIQRLAGSWETIDDVGGALADLVRYDLPRDYWSKYGARIQALELDDAQQAARKIVRPGQVIWLIVGDLEKIKAPIRELGLGPVQILDADGNAIE